jgi:hypothetical protein
LEVEFPDILQVISQMYHPTNEYITVKRLRKVIGVDSEDGKQVRKLANTLVWLELFGFLELDRKQTPKRYRIPPDFALKTKDIIRMYPKKKKKEINESF